LTPKAKKLNGKAVRPGEQLLAFCIAKSYKSEIFTSVSRGFYRRFFGFYLRFLDFYRRLSDFYRRFSNFYLVSFKSQSPKIKKLDGKTVRSRERLLAFCCTKSYNPKLYLRF
jgi:hypothetical protein